MPDQSDTQMILDRIADIDKKLGEFTSAQTQMCKAAQASRDEHHKTLYGNGARGLNARVQDVESKVGMIWLGVVGFIGVVFKFVWDAITTR